MKSVVLTALNQMEMVEIPAPEIQNPDDVLLKLLYTGVCGSDIHYFKEGKIGDQQVKYPFTVGHECVAQVEQTGPLVKNIKSGDTVVVEPCISCRKCPQCLAGREHTCLHQKFLGSPGQLDGCLSEFMVMPDRNCYQLSEGFSPEKAVLVEPLSIGYYAAQFLKNKKLLSAGILGVGPIGLSVLLMLLQLGDLNIYVTDKLDYRIDAALQAGALDGGNPDKEDVVEKIRLSEPELLDVVFECCGKQEAIDQAVHLLKPGGVLVIVGIPEVDRISFDISQIRRKEITIQNVRRQNKSIQPVIDLITENKIQPDFMITHKFPFAKTVQAFNLVSGYADGVIKALIRNT